MLSVTSRPRHGARWAHLALASALLSWAGSASGAEAPSLTLTLPQAIERALAAAPEVAQAAGERSVAQASERSALGAYLPTVSASAGGTLADTWGGSTSTDRLRLDAGLNASWDLFLGFRRNGKRAQTRAALSAADAGATRSAADVALSVQRAFYDGLRAKELAAVAAQREKRATESAQAASRRAAAGAATRSDELRTQLELNSARQDLLAAAAERRAASYTLGRLVGADGPAEPADGPSEALEPEDALERLVDELVESAPAVDVARAEVEAAAAGRVIARGAYFPELRLGAGTAWTSATTPLAPDGARWSVDLTLSYTLFDGFRRSEDVERASVRERVALAVLDDTRRAIRAQAEQLVGALRLARERITLTTQAVEVASEDLRAQSERYGLGVTTMLELLTSQTRLAEAEQDLIGARFDYRLARASLRALAGRIE